MKEKIVQGFMFVIYLVAGGVCGFLGMYYLDRYYGEGNVVPVFITFLCDLFLCNFVQIIIHECGHLIFGMLTGYKFLSIRFGNMMWIKTDKGIKFKKFSLAGTGGQCLLDPPEIIDGTYPFVLYHAGGVLMNVIVSIICGLLMFVVKNPVIQLFLVYMIFMGFTFVITNGIPLSINDGHNIMDMKKNPQIAYHCWQQMKLAALSTQDIRLKDIPEDYFDETIGFTTSLDIAIYVLTYQRYMDQKDYEKAENLINEILKINDIVDLHKHMITNDLIFIKLLKDEDVSLYLDKKHLKYRKALKNLPTFIRTEYALALSKNENADKYLKELDKIASTYPYQVDIDSEYEQIHYYQEYITNKSQ